MVKLTVVPLVVFACTSKGVVASSPKGNAPSVRFVTVEEWRLSADTKTLTIKTEIKSPDIPADGMSLAFPNNPETEKYQRVEPQ